MKYLIFLSFFFIASCANNKGVYWCGDHACVSKKEREIYFRNTMTVEIRELDKREEKNISQTELIIKKAVLDTKNKTMEQKDLTKQARLEEKRRIKKEKDLAKQARLEEKRRIKKEKDLAKQARLKGKKLPKNNTLQTKNIKQEKKILDNYEKSTNLASNKFSQLVEKITKKNMFRPYPDINDIPY